MGIDTKSGQIHDFVYNEAMDYLALTETWLWADDQSTPQIGDITGPGVSCHRHARKWRSEAIMKVLRQSTISGVIHLL